MDRSPLQLAMMRITDPRRIDPAVNLWQIILSDKGIVSMSAYQSLKPVFIASLASLLAISPAANAEYKSPDVRKAENALKMIIGMNHMRCAEVVYVAKLQGSVYGVTCIKRAGRKERARYAVDGANNAVVGMN